MLSHHPLPLRGSLLAIALAGCLPSAAHAGGQTARSVRPVIVHRVTANHKNFLIDGKRFQIISGEMHYSRIPREYWRDRLKKARAMGLNTISTYVFWNVQEPRPGVYDLSGNNDVAAFIRMAQEEGLYVILRPGPYVCAEWDLGGYPAWLLADPNVVLRSSDPSFMVPAKRWLMRLGKELAPLQASRGGPIIAVQIENEYGSFGKDHNYMRQIRNTIVQSGLGEVLLYTADGPEELSNGALPGVQAVVNFGPGDAQKAFAALKNFRPHEPLMAGEYWDGWFDHWGQPHHVTDTAQQVKDLSSMLSQGYSVNLYMFEGGTTFGFMNGANIDGKFYNPDTTSYDYDAALDEAGRPTAKYFAFRNVIARHDGNAALPPVPAAIPIIQVPEISLAQAVSLWDALPKPILSEQPQPMEPLGQSYGYILYRKQIVGPAQGDLVLQNLHDYAVIYLNGRQAGTLDRRALQDRLAITVPAEGAQLDILVENTGRVNYGPAIRGERSGITNSIAFAGHPLTGWQIYRLPMEDPATLRFSSLAVKGPAFYRGTFQLSQVGDTFLDTRGLGKGAVWVNGHALGRFWSIGPQRTLYLPGAWLRKGVNNVVVFDLFGQPGREIQAMDHPILSDLE
ncbi:MAG: glycoside hydrolase family 35 protein [Acidobacteriaceae bacterium]